ncbi:MAG: MATE family efflux transporter [Oscillospiraceae bacterium]|nr:MATE family efflux transporter [Oscillospiraceae bacterium]
MDIAEREKLQYKKMTETPIPRLVIKLGIPTTLSMLVTSVYNMADTFFLGTYGTSASGAVGIVFGLMSILQAFGFMFGQGAGSLSSRALGAKDVEKASRYSSTGFFAAMISGAVIAVFGIIFIDPFMMLLGSTDTILPYARSYAVYILIAAPFLCASCVLNNVLRFEGQAVLATVGLASGGILNIFGDWLLMSVYKFGVTGAGISTAVSQCISFGILLAMFFSGKTSGKISFRMISKNFNDWFDICKTGFPSLVRQGLTSISTMLLNNSAEAYGDEAIAAMSIVNRICFFTFATSLGIGQGFQPVCAFNYGAKKYGRVKSAFIFTLIAGEILLGTVALIGLIFSSDLVRLFRNDPEVIRIGTFALSAQFIGQFLQPVAVCSNMMFQSAGKSGIATLLSMMRSGLFFIPILLILSATHGLLGIQLSQAIADVLTTAASLPFAVWFLRKLSNLQAAEKT